MGQISIAAVLSQLDQAVVDNKPTQHHIKYTKLDGNLGECRDAQKAQKRAKAPGNPNQHTAPAKAWGHNMKYSGNILLWSESKGHAFEVKIDLIYYFNGNTVKH
jgi:hypothetical protein